MVFNFLLSCTGGGGGGHSFNCGTGVLRGYTFIHFNRLMCSPLTEIQLLVLKSRLVAPVSVNATVSVNVDNNGRYRSCYCKRVYNNGTVSVNGDSNGSDLSRYCHRLH